MKDVFIIRLEIDPELEEIQPVCSHVSSGDDDTFADFQSNLSPCVEEVIINDDFQMRSQTVTSIVDKALKEYLRCHLHIERLPEAVSKDVPSIVKRYCELLLDDDIPLRALEAVIKDTREHWLKRAKLIYQVKSQKPDIDMNSVLKIVGCKNSDFSMLTFWQSGLSKAYKEHIQREIEFSRRKSIKSSTSDVKL